MNTFIVSSKIYKGLGIDQCRSINSTLSGEAGYFSTQYGRLGKDIQKVKGEDIQKNNKRGDLYGSFHKVMTLKCL